MRKNRSEMILHGNIYKIIAIISVPIILNNFIQQLYSLADAFWLGKLGTAEFASTSFTWPVVFLFNSIGIGLSIAAISLISQLLGKKCISKAQKYADTLIYISLIFSIIFTFLGFFSAEFIVNLMGANGDLAKYSVIYLKYSYLGIPFIFLYYIYSAIFSSQGKNTIPTMISTSCVILNMILNPIFIFDTIPYTNFSGLGLGVQGAALATVLTQGIMCFAGLVHLRFNKDMLKLNLQSLIFIPLEKTILSKIYTIALPSVIGQIGTAIGFIIMNSFIQSYGTETVAAYGMVNRISGLLNIPPGGIGSAITSIIGQNIGNHNIKRVKETFKKASVIVIFMSVIIAIISFIFRYEILSFFIDAPKSSELMIQANSYMFYTLITLVMLNMFFIYQGLFQGSGNSKYSMFIDMIRLWVIRIPLILYFKYFTNLGATGIWLSMSISNVLVTLIAHYIYSKGNWQMGSFR
ncbi:MAG: MATE family efflux transporter [Peptoniphilaceae bacterium]|uniref:MATE family efflux transporter n=1 Tax=Parvimonas sp. TaxID=1944660 RepID=UPI0025DC1310|nr:MATE family efflux transporter [Parvimonas sp.]MCI5997302.1 MATE family efflux transporter [Parvimonas sp.]MDD7765424.1 MATE family efflux transporter [Peptoniphilaceae bacterium]MDY3050965.1 MATE family efflux transporter [Parvimonas sp.]